MNRKTSIVILTYNHLEDTIACIESIYKYTEKGTYEIIIVDNASTDETRTWLKEQKNIKVIYNDQNMGFPKGCNQGIEIADSENDILLLNNDTVVTENWLKNLKICLYSDSKIGAVGSVCNHDENKQGVDFTYQDMEQMQILARKNNISDPNRWEEKVFLIGFCLLIKREVIEKLEVLDEGYTPGYIEDNDFSLRILTLGYRLFLCHDSFIHHHLGTSFRKNLDEFYKILNKNRVYFKQKWYFETPEFDALKSASFPLLGNPKKVLELNTGIGVTQLALKYHDKNVEIEGVEPDIYKRQIASLHSKVYPNLKEVKKQYDTILIGDLLEKVKDPSFFLEKIKNYLTEDGVLIGEIHNLASIK